MSPELISLFLLGISVVLLVLIATVIPWTRAAIALWLVTAVSYIAASLLFTQAPLILRAEVAVLVLGWALILLFPEQSPIYSLTRAEWTCQKVISRVSAAARASFEAGTFSDDRAGFIAELEALQPPDDLWRTVKTAQLLDLRAEPAQVGVGDATNRLVTWPWQDALDHRIVPFRIRLDDALRARSIRRIAHPGFEDMTSSMRYAYLFIGNLWRRFEDLQAREGGLTQNPDEAAALSALAAAVRPPNARWAKVQGLTVEIMDLEIKAATLDLSPAEQERLLAARDDMGQTLAHLTTRDLIMPTEATDDPGNRPTPVG